MEETNFTDLRSRSMRNRILICVAVILSFVFAFAPAKGDGVRAKPLDPSVDPYLYFSPTKARKLMSQLTANKAGGEFPVTAFDCRVWHDDEYHKFWILIVQTHTLLRVEDCIFSLSEAHYMLLWEGTWNLRKGLSEYSMGVFSLGTVAATRLWRMNHAK